MAVGTNRQAQLSSGAAITYRPRALLILECPATAMPTPAVTWGYPGFNPDTQPAIIRVPVRSLTLCSNNHNEADTASVVVDWNSAGIDPREISDGIGTILVGEADPNTGEWDAPDSDIRFIGVMKRIKRQGGESEGLLVEMMFHDYTTLFLEAKKYPTSGIPLLSDTLSGAWQKICANTGSVNPNNPKEILPTVKVLADRLVFQGGAKDVVLGDATSGRFKTIARVQTKRNADAWACWQQCCGMLGLITYIRLDQCIVTTSTDYYTANNAPVLLWGRNIRTLSEERDASMGNRGIVLQSFDPLNGNGTMLEAFYPPLGDPSVSKKRVPAKRRGDQGAVLNAEDRVVFPYPGVTSQAALDDIAQSVYVQWSRQELEGTITTVEMSVLDEVGNGFDLLTLAAGDSVRIDVDRDDTEALGQFDSDTVRVNYLVGLGYDVGLAQLVVANLRSLLDLSPIYLVKRVETRLVVDEGDSGSFEITVNYCNKITPTGASAQDPAAQPQVH